MLEMVISISKVCLLSAHLFYDSPNSCKSESGGDGAFRRYCGRPYGLKGASCSEMCDI